MQENIQKMEFMTSFNKNYYKWSGTAKISITEFIYPYFLKNTKFCKSQNVILQLYVVFSRNCNIICYGPNLRLKGKDAVFSKCSLTLIEKRIEIPTSHVSHELFYKMFPNKQF